MLPFDPWLLFTVWCSVLFVVCCVLRDVRDVLFACCLLHVASYFSAIVYCLM